ncbi:MAG: hypothetical protein EBZ77_16465 [Chitinophagia bacterium]|nr:hypothetical protein [Chitinophagia bacterium]
MKIRTQAFLPLFFGVLLHGWFFIGTASAAASTAADKQQQAGASTSVKSPLGSVGIKVSVNAQTPTLPAATPTAAPAKPSFLGGLFGKITGSKPATPDAAAPAKNSALKDNRNYRYLLQ